MKSHHEAPGVQVSRRTALHGAAALPAMAMLARWARTRAPHGEDADVFVREWAARAAELVESDAPNEEAHLFELCAGLARLEPGAFPGRKATVFDEKGVKTGPVHGDPKFLVLEIELEPGAVIPAHNHVGWCFVSLGVKGAALVRHFEPLAGAPAPDALGVDFQVRQVSSAWLAPGRTSTLTRARANVHWFRAGEEGATLLDFGVHFEDPGRGPKVFSAMEFDAEPVDASRGVHTARWLGNIYADDD